MSTPRVRAWWTGAAILLLAVNLRPAAIAVSPLLDQISRSEGLSATSAGVLAALPVFCFGAFAPLAPRLSARFGIERVLFGALILLCAGFALRYLDSLVALFAGTVVAGASIAAGNVLLPGLIKRDFAHRAGLMTGLYTMSINAGASLSAGLTIPLQRAAGTGWHGALASWAGLALVTLFIWIPQARAAQHRTSRAAAHPGLWRDATAWHVTAFMGLQSLCYYAISAWLPAVFVSRGLDPAAAGGLLSLASAAGIVASIVAPVLAERARNQVAALVAATAVTALGVAGMLTVPGAAIPTVIVIGAGQGAAISLALTTIVLRSPDGQHAARLSGMAQCVGYMVAAAGPFALGALHDATGGWTVPLLALIALLFPQGVMGALAGRKRLVGSASHEDRDTLTAPV